jgi:peptidoglycan/xylan/chitin deacetylase (PgdA/CDA1 family)
LRNDILLKKIAKNLFLFLFVFLYSKFRNFIYRYTKGCHLCVLVYHRVNDELKDSVTVSVKQFREQILFVKKYYEVFDLHELPNLSSKKLKRPVVAVTFDDGYADNFEAARFLAENNIRASFFVTTRIVGTEYPFPHDLKRLGVRIPTLSWDQIKQMANWGHIISSHTAHHPNLSTLDDEQAISQIKMGQDDLVNKLGEKASTQLFAYPHGRKEDLPSGARKDLPNLDIKFCFSAYGGINYADFDPYDINRQGIDNDFSLLAFRAALEGWKVRVPARS